MILIGAMIINRENLRNHEHNTYCDNLGEIETRIKNAILQYFFTL